MVLDIDGVITRKPNLIPGSKGAVQRLRNACVPHIFMTNGGGVTEAAKAAQLATWLEDDSIDETRVLLSHTPFRALAERFRDERVLIVGGPQCLAVAEEYGFDVLGGKALSPQQIAAGTDGIYPFRRRGSGDAPSQPSVDVNVNSDGERIKAVLIFHDPLDWAMELQIITDVLMGGRPLGTPSPDKPPAQSAELFVSNPDFLWQAAYPVPRYGMGAFTQCLHALWARLTGTELQITQFGKPMRSQFEAAAQLVETQASGPVERLYMIGDNPAADVRGANGAGDPWRSILVCTGVYQGGPSNNDATDPAWRVEQDLASAVDRLLQPSANECF